MFFSSNLLSQATKFLLSRIHICQPTEKISDNQTLSPSSSTKKKKKKIWNVFYKEKHSITICLNLYCTSSLIALIAVCVHFKMDI